MIYLDNAATTRPQAYALADAEPFIQDSFYNPSALYRGGFGVHKSLETAREDILRVLGAGEGYELVFTGTGTEADNQTLFSCARRGNLVISGGEHPAVYECAKELSLRGIEVRTAKLNRDGSVNEEDLLSLVDEKTKLVSVIHVSNETGAVNDIGRLSMLVKRINPSARFHSDGVQAFGKVPYTLSGVDYYVICAHKIGGVRGAAALVRKKDAPLKPLMYGGGQEAGARSGTENTFAIEAFRSAAVYRHANRERLFACAKRSNAYMREHLDPAVYTVLSGENASPYILSVSAENLRGEVLQHMADDKGVVVGTGSACSSKKKGSRVLTAAGVPVCLLGGVLRISFLGEETESEIREACDVLNDCGRELWDKVGNNRGNHG